MDCRQEFANVTEIQTNESATEVTGVRVATLNGTNFTVSAKLVVIIFDMSNINFDTI
jgi:hypothetical protein